ncbi:putative tuberous sclerosis 1 protein [Podospora australis]|uniref:Tuberous sclerosis 1 protein n=1 Tax=Podospora australis TaxID=1536484 RepID=A0AAN6X638_9PEZI|nr:putative tuberous sclerosis 1 protein [Podospora australis]
MTSSGSSKDLCKALISFLQSSPSIPLPADVAATINSYVQKHDRADEGVAEKLNDDLTAIWEKVVHGSPERYASFLVILRELRPVLRSPGRIFDWWDRLLDPLLERVAYEKGLAREVLEHSADVLSHDDQISPAEWTEAGTSPLVTRLLERWMDICTAGPDPSHTAELKERMIKQALMAFGKRDPKSFMRTLDGFVVQRRYRNSAFNLLADFLGSQPPHLHLILQTPLLGSILQSLQKDESTNTVTRALLTLVMIMPSIPSSLVPFLPTLFNIYARLLFWDRDSVFSQQNTEMGEGKEGLGGSSGPWEKILLDPDMDGNTILYLTNYFTILYGLYPINFLDYIRKPHRYLRHANNPDDIDVQAMEIRDRSDRFRRQHLLHPNFYSLTIETEKTDLSRWIRCEAEEIMTDCMALYVEPPLLGFDMHTSTLPQTSTMMLDESLDDDMDSALLGGAATDSSNQGRGTPSLGIDRSINSSRTGLRSESPSSHREIVESRSHDRAESPPPSRPLMPSSSHSRLQDLIHSNKAIKSGLHQSLNNDSVPSLVLSPQEQPPTEKSSTGPTSARPPRQEGGAPVEQAADQIAVLHHQNLLLHNDLQYEKYVKQQHIEHMGELRRKQVREAATEAETQNLVMANRSLKQRLDEAKRSEAQIRKEFDHRRNMAKRWENDLSNKLRILREEQKKWSVEGNELKQQLEKAQAECKSLRQIVDEAEKKRLESEQNLVAVDISTAMIEGLKKEIARLSAAEHAFQGKEVQMLAAIQEAADAEARVEQMKQELAALENELQQERRRYEAQIYDLKTQVNQAAGSKHQQPNTNATVYESALAAARAKNTDLQRQYAGLMRKYTVLQSNVLDLQAEAAERAGRSSDAEFMHYPTDTSSSIGGSPIAIRSRQQSDAFDGIAHNATPPLDPPVSSSVGSVVHRPSTPSGLAPAAAEASGSGKNSPHSERYFGRGGVQNAKKDKKDKKEDKGDKKDKKLGTGIRGIRGFV